MSRFQAIAATPGYEFLVARRRDGWLRSYPIVGWSLAMREDGGTDYLLPIVPCFVAGSPDMAYAVRWPDGSVHSVASDWPYRNADEWIFDVRTLECCPHELQGTA